MLEFTLKTSLIHALATAEAAFVRLRSRCDFRKTVA